MGNLCRSVVLVVASVPGLYARLQGTAGLRVSRRFDVVAQLGAHVSSIGQQGSYLSSGVGLRLRLP